MDVDEMFLLTLIGADFVFSRLTGNGEEERKRHGLPLERLQKERDEWNKWKAQKAKRKYIYIYIYIYIYK